MSEIVWEDPPLQQRRGGCAWLTRLAPLREHPGKWANLGRFHSNTASQIKRGRLAGIEVGEFEATTRDVDRKTGYGTLYVRYVGDES